MHTGKYANKCSKLKDELADLKLLISDQFSSQVKINCDLQAQLETTKLKLRKISALNCELRLLSNQYRELKGGMKTLMKLLRGKLSSHVCPCGRKINIRALIETEEVVTAAGDESRSFTGANIQSNIVESTIADDDDGETALLSKVDDVVLEEKGVQTGKYTYTDDATERIGNPNQGWNDFGEVECLNAAGECRFIPADHQAERWVGIVEDKLNMSLDSRLVLLPRELSGVTVMFTLCRRDDDDTARMRIFVPDIDENVNIPLPVKLTASVQLMMDIGGGEYYVRRFDKQTLHIVKLGYYIATEDDYTIALDKVRVDKLPEITFTF